MKNVFIHESSWVDEGAEIGEGTKIWYFSHVEKGAKIGKDCSLGQGIGISGTAVIGDRCRFQNYAFVGDNVTFEEDIFCGPSVVFAKKFHVKTQKNNIEIPRTIIRKGASLGANCTIYAGCEIGSWALIGASAVVTEDVLPYSLVMGNPAKRVAWVCECGQTLKNGLSCKCGRKYIEKNNSLEEVK